MIRDNAGNPISTYIGNIAPSEVQICTMQIDCVANENLTCAATTAFVVEARALGDTDWIDIENEPIDLTPYAPATQAFEVRVTGSAGLAGRNQFAVRVGH